MTQTQAKRNDCPICGSERIAFAFRIHYWRENLLEFSDCAECGASFANPMPSDALIARGNDALVRLSQAERTNEQEFREARQAYLRGKLLARKLRRWKRKGRLLELGCSNGFFLLGFKENSEWEVEGLEISADLCAFIESNLGIKAHASTLENAELPDGRFDFIVCHDLIEHVNDAGRFLRKLSSILAPGGRVQIITPNGRQDLGYVRRAEAAGMPAAMLLNHILLFRPRTLRLALERAGLTPRRLYCYDVRHALKDFDFMGLGTRVKEAQAPSLEESLRIEPKRTLGFWTPAKIAELKKHPRTSLRYGFFKEMLPGALRLRVHEALEIGHEIYALAEK